MDKGFEKIEKEIEKRFVERGSMIDIESIEGATETRENQETRQAREEIAAELEKEPLTAAAEGQARRQAEEMQSETEQGKIQRLLEIAETRGLAFAVETAKKMNDFALLDKFHDALVENQLFKKYLNK